MNWSRAKNILIVVFLLSNIYLSIVLINTSGDIKKVSQEKVEETTSYLKKHNIIVNCKVPNKAENLPIVIVKYKDFSKNEIKGMFFNEMSGVKDVEDRDEIRVYDDKTSILIKNNIEFNYTNKAVEQVDNVDVRKSRTVAQSFVKLFRIENADKYLIDTERTKGYVRLIYKQNYRKLHVDDSFLEIYANQNGVYNARVLWFDTIKQSERPMEVITSVGALLAVWSEFKSVKDAVEITGIEQGYYFNTEYMKQFDVSRAIEGTAFPVWKITTNKGILYVNAYDGKVETILQAY